MAGRAWWVGAQCGGWVGGNERGHLGGWDGALCEVQSDGKGVAFPRPLAARTPSSQRAMVHKRRSPPIYANAMLA